MIIAALGLITLVLMIITWRQESSISSLERRFMNEHRMHAAYRQKYGALYQEPIVLKEGALILMNKKSKAKKGKTTRKKA
jgi:hypothetical protein